MNISLVLESFGVQGDPTITLRKPSLLVPCAALFIHGRPSLKNEVYIKKPAVLGTFRRR